MAEYFVDNKNSTSVQTGCSKNPFATIGQAADIALPGDTVIVCEGIYRERVAPNNGGEQGRRIIYKSELFGKAIIKGSNIYTGIFQRYSEWDDIYSIFLPKDEYGDTFYTPMADTFTIPDHYTDWPEEQRPQMINGQMVYGDQTLYPSLSLGQVFVNGESIYEKTSLKSIYSNENTWFFDKELGVLYINYKNIDDVNNVIELTARNRIFAPYKRGLGYITVEGFSIAHCGNQFPALFWNKPENAQAGAISTRSGHHWHIKNNFIYNIKSIGIDIGCECRDVDVIEGYSSVPIIKIRNHVIEENKFYDCGVCAITGLGHYNTIIANNYIEKSNSLNFSSPETAGIKFHYCYDADIYGNTIINSNCDGIWLDNIYTGSKIHHNNLIRCATSGIMLELGKGPVEVFNNFVYQTRRGLYKPDPRGSGIYAHDAEGIYVHDNVVSDCDQFGIYMRVVTNRWCGEDDGLEHKQILNTANIVIENNALLNNAMGEICLPYVGPRAYNNICRNNIIFEYGKMIISVYGNFDEFNSSVIKNSLLDLASIYKERYGSDPIFWKQQDMPLGIIISREEFDDLYERQEMKTND